MEIVAADIGGTHARFAIAEIGRGRVTALGAPLVLKTADYPSLDLAWAHFTGSLGRPVPRRAGIAVACPVNGDELKLTNNPWLIRPAQLRAELGLDHCTLVNDFGAVSHAVVQFEPAHLRHLRGPDLPLPDSGVISIVGPGTGLGVGLVLRRNGHDHIVECEGGHIGFAPVDEVDDAILARLRPRFPRVSAERVISGPGLAQIHAALAAPGQDTFVARGDEKLLWQTAIEGREPAAAAALERFCQALGSFAGDIALAHGASAVVIGGGLGLRLAEVLPRSGFGAQFVAKGRFEPMMARMPVKLIVHPDAGLFGAAAACASELAQGHP